MYLGRIVEEGPQGRRYSRDRAHPYTRALLASTPSLAAAKRAVRAPLTGELPSPLDPPTGCAFHKRCPYAIPRCVTEVPQLLPLGSARVACHRAEELNA